MQNKLKILDVRPNTKPLVQAGDQETNKLYILNEYSKALKKYGCDVTVAYSKGEEDKEVERRTAADRTVFLNNKKIKPLGKIIPAAFYLRKIIKREKFDVVICHWLKQGMVVALATLFQPSVSRYVVMHGPSNIHKFRRKLFAFLFLRRRFTYIAVSEAMRNYLLDINWKLPSDQIITHYNTIDIRAMEKNHLPREEIRNKFGLQEKDIGFVTIGWLSPRKGQIDILQALDLLGNEIYNLKIVIFGDGGLKNFLQQETRKRQLDSKVFFAGGLPDAYQYLAGFDVYIHPSHREPFGVAILEAMAAKLPIIASNVGGIPEVMGPLGTLVPPNDHHALAKAMKDYYSMSGQERRELGLKGYDRLWSHFSNEVFASKLCSIIEQK